MELFRAILLKVELHAIETTGSKSKSVQLPYGFYTRHLDRMM